MFDWPSWAYIVIAIFVAAFLIQRSLAALGTMIGNLPDEIERARTHMGLSEYYEMKSDESLMRTEAEFANRSKGQ